MAVGTQYVKEVIEEARHGRQGVLRGIIISERWKREKCQKVERAVNGNTGPACPVISAGSRRIALFPEASAFPPPPVQDILSAAVAANRRHQSHWLRKRSLPISPLLWRQLLELVSQICSSVCSASKDIYLHIVTTTHTHTHTTRTEENALIALPEPKSTPSEFVAVLLSPSFSLCSWMLDLLRQNPPHVLHVSWAYSLHLSIKGSPRHTSSWMKTCPLTFWKILVR